MTHVRKQVITVEGEFAYDSMRLELLIDLDSLLRDGGVPWIGEWDANGSFMQTRFTVLRARRDVVKLTFCANHCGCGTCLLRCLSAGLFTFTISRVLWLPYDQTRLPMDPCGSATCTRPCLDPQCLFLIPHLRLGISHTP